MYKFLNILLVSFAIIAISASNAFADNHQNTLPIAVVAVASGQSTITHNGQTQALSEAQDIYIGDKIQTGSKARAVLVFIDDTEVTLGSDATFSADHFQIHDGTPSKNQGLFSIAKGAFLLTSGSISQKKKDAIVVNTDYGSIGIRGTTFWGGVIKQDYRNSFSSRTGSNENFGVLVTDGAVEFKNDVGTVLIENGKGSFARNRADAPSNPKVWTYGQVLSATSKVALPSTLGADEKIARAKSGNDTLYNKHLSAQ